MESGVFGVVSLNYGKDRNRSSFLSYMSKYNVAFDKNKKLDVKLIKYVK